MIISICEILHSLFRFYTVKTKLQNNLTAGAATVLFRKLMVFLATSCVQGKAERDMAKAEKERGELMQKNLRLSISGKCNRAF